MSARGTSNGNSAGSAEARRRRKLWLLDVFGDGTHAACRRCWATLVFETLTVDRHPTPGARGGTYRRGNIRPMCGRCNSQLGCQLRDEMRREREAQSNAEATGDPASPCCAEMVA